MVALTQQFSPNKTPTSHLLLWCFASIRTCFPFVANARKLWCSYRNSCVRSRDPNLSDSSMCLTVLYDQHNDRTELQRTICVRRMRNRRPKNGQSSQHTGMEKNLDFHKTIAKSYDFQKRKFCVASVGAKNCKKTMSKIAKVIGKKFTGHP